MARLDHGRIVEQGRIVDLLTTRLRARPRPAAAPIPAEPGDRLRRAWYVAYDSRTVPADWLQPRLGRPGRARRPARRVDRGSTARAPAATVGSRLGRPGPAAFARHGVRAALRPGPPRAPARPAAETLGARQPCALIVPSAFMPRPVATPPFAELPALLVPALGETLAMVGIVMAIVVLVGAPLRCPAQPRAARPVREPRPSTA